MVLVVFLGVLTCSEADFSIPWGMGFGYVLFLFLFCHYCSRAIYIYSVPDCFGTCLVFHFGIILAFFGWGRGSYFWAILQILVRADPRCSDFGNSFFFFFFFLRPVGILSFVDSMIAYLTLVFTYILPGILYLQSRKIELINRA